MASDDPPGLSPREGFAIVREFIGRHVLDLLWERWQKKTGMHGPRQQTGEQVRDEIDRLELWHAVEGFTDHRPTITGILPPQPPPQVDDEAPSDTLRRALRLMGEWQEQRDQDPRVLAVAEDVHVDSRVPPGTAYVFTPPSEPEEGPPPAWPMIAMPDADKVRFRLTSEGPAPVKIELA